MTHTPDAELVRLCLRAMLHDAHVGRFAKGTRSEAVIIARALRDRIEAGRETLHNRAGLKALGWLDDSLDNIESMMRDEHLGPDFLNSAAGPEPTTAAHEIGPDIVSEQRRATSAETFGYPKVQTEDQDRSGQPTTPAQVPVDAEVAEIEKELGALNDFLHRDFPVTSAIFRDNVTKAIKLLRILRERAPGARGNESPHADEHMLEVLRALEDLSFACFAPIAPCSRPSLETYNRTWEVLDKQRKRLGIHPDSVKGFQEKERSPARTTTQQANTAHHIAPRKDGGTGVGSSSLPPAGPGVDREALAKWFSGSLARALDERISDEDGAIFAQMLIASGLVTAWPDKQILIDTLSSLDRSRKSYAEWADAILDLWRKP